jgi:hypothetical protein
MAKPAVRQIKGPGMNLGLKKPRKNYIPKPQPYKQSKAMKDAMSTEPSSYLPNSPVGKKPRKGKTPSYL